MTREFLDSLIKTLLSRWVKKKKIQQLIDSLGSNLPRKLEKWTQFLSKSCIFISNVKQLLFWYCKNDISCHYSSHQSLQLAIHSPIVLLHSFPRKSFSLHKLGQFCYVEQFLVSVNYLFTLTEEDGGLLSEDTNLDTRWRWRKMIVNRATYLISNIQGLQILLMSYWFWYFLKHILIE